MDGRAITAGEFAAGMQLVLSLLESAGVPPADDRMKMLARMAGVKNDETIRPNPEGDAMEGGAL